MSKGKEGGESTLKLSRNGLAKERRRREAMWWMQELEAEGYTMKRSGLARDVHEILFLSFPPSFPSSSLLFMHHFVQMKIQIHRRHYSWKCLNLPGVAEKIGPDPQKFHLKHWWP